MLQMRTDRCKADVAGATTLQCMKARKCECMCAYKMQEKEERVAGTLFATGGILRRCWFTTTTTTATTTTTTTTEALYNVSKRESSESPCSKPRAL